MTWMDNLSSIQTRIEAHQILLSDALIETKNVMQKRSPDTISFWLNREIVGYKFSDVQYMRANSFNQELRNRLVLGVPCSSLTGEILGENRLHVFLRSGIQDIENRMSEYFDVSLLHGGNRDRISRAIRKSRFLTDDFFVEHDDLTDTLVKFQGASVLNVYDQTKISLIRLLTLTPLTFAGPSILVI